jgi:hypothetical protein
MLREAGFEIIPTAKTYAIARENEGLMATLRSIADRQPGESTRLYAQFVVSQVSAALRAGSENGVLSGSHEPVRMAQGPFDGADT